jgi:hypothetical protein
MWKWLPAFRAINMARRRSCRLQSLATLHAENRVAHHLRAALGASYHTRFTLIGEQLRAVARTEFRLVVIRGNIIRYSERSILKSQNCFPSHASLLLISDYRYRWI